MFDGPAVSNTAHNLTEILGWMREVSIIGFLLGLAWKARGIVDNISRFFDRITDHMTHMENFATEVVENHLKHIEDDMAELARGRRRDDRATDREEREQQEHEDSKK